MASTYSTSLKLELIGNGDQSGTWGTTTNNNLGTLLEQAITGVQNITMANADYTLSNYNGAADEARNAVLVIGGTNSAIRNIIAPAVEKVYVIKNSTSGGYAVNVKTSASTGINIANGTTAIVYCDSSEFYFVTYGSASTNTPNTVVLRDGSGNFAANAITAATLNATTSVTTAAVTTAALTTTGPFTAGASVGTAGQALLSQGAGLPPVWGAAFVAGMIMLWSGSSGSIPSGWLLCDGTNSTPDLRNRFVVGAGSTYAVNATGGSADAVVVSHTHTVTDPGHEHTLSGLRSYNVSLNDIQMTTLLPNNTGQGSPATSTSLQSATTGLTVDTAGVSGTNANLPPYYALCYIMKS